MATQVTLNSGSVDSAGSLALKTNGTTTAITIGTDQSVNFAATGQRITGDFSNATAANRVLFQTSTTNGSTALEAIPNGTSTISFIGVSSSSSDPANTSVGSILMVGATEFRIQSTVRGTGTYLPMTFNTGGSERVRVDTSGNVGIGTSSPTVKLDVRGNVLKIYDSGSTNANLTVRNSTTGDAAGFTLQQDGVNTLFYNNSNGASVFATNGTERARIDSSGNLLVGVTSLLSGAERFALSSSAADWTQVTRNSNASPFGMLINYSAATPNGTGNAFISCYDNNVGNQRFTVRSNGGIANYTANNSPLSDRRLKKNITPAGSYLDKICAIPVVTYFYNDQTDDLPNLGVIAQDVQLAAPELCNEEGWGTKAEDGSTYLGIWETDIQYALMKSIQELKALVDTQASTITTLTDRITALEAK